VFYEEKFLCRALCTQLESSAISLKEIVRARNEKRKDLKDKLTSRSSVVADYIAAHVMDQANNESMSAAESPAPAKPKLRRYRDDY
jgi:putative transposase